MSIESWKQEFFINEYQSYVGFRPENLAKHGLKKGLDHIYEIDNKDNFLHEGEIPSLCDKFKCETCPIFFHKGSDCSEEDDDLVHNNNPEPMIEFLKNIPEAHTPYD